MQNAAVLPEPVRAITTVSLPERITGRDFLWTGVGIYGVDILSFCGRGYMYIIEKGSAVVPSKEKM